MIKFPATLDEFTGNENNKKILNLLIENHTKHQIDLPNVMLYGKPGLGKSLLASLCFKKLGVQYYSTIGEQLTKELLLKIFQDIKPFYGIFIDEIHSIDKKTSELLYPILQDKKVYDDTDVIDISGSNIWFFGATTEFGTLEKPLRDRFQYPLYMEPYTDDNLKEITLYLCKELNIEIATPVINKLPELSQGTPRILKRIILACNDFMVYYSRKTLDETLLKLVLATLGITWSGLSRPQQVYMDYMQKLNTTVGINSISTTLGFNSQDIESNIEPYLVEKLYILKTPRGRQITPLGLELNIKE